MNAWTCYFDSKTVIPRNKTKHWLQYQNVRGTLIFTIMNMNSGCRLQFIGWLCWYLNCIRFTVFFHISSTYWRNENAIKNGQLVCFYSLLQFSFIPMYTRFVCMCETIKRYIWRIQKADKRTNNDAERKNAHCKALLPEFLVNSVANNKKLLFYG